MEANWKQRMIAYVIDLLIVGLLLGMIITMKEKDEKVMQLRSDWNIVSELYGSGEMKFLDYFERATLISQEIDQECAIYSIFNICFILGYFVLLPLLWHGQTLGKRLMKIQVVSANKEKLTVMNYLIRNIILNGLGYMILVLLFLYILPNKMYFVIESIFSFIQIALVIISIFMVLYRKDKRGLHDILGGTKVVSMS